MTQNRAAWRSMKWTLVLVAALLPLLVATIFARSHGVRPIGRPIDEGTAAFDRAIGLDDAASDARRAAFAEAASHFAEALAMERTPGIAYNLGNARLRAGDTPGAIAAYLTAQRLAPGDARVAANLAEARRLAASPLAPPAPTFLERARGLWSPHGTDIRLVVALGSWSAGFALLVWAMLSARSGPGRAMGIALATVGALVMATLAIDAAAIRGDDRAVLGTSTMARKGNGLGFEPAFADMLPAGTEFRLREARPGWREIELSDGARGWIEESTIQPRDA